MNMHPFTFKRFDSYLEIFRKPGASSIDITFQMRTFEPTGVLFYTNLSEPRSLMVGINDVPDQDFLRVNRLRFSTRLHFVCSSSFFSMPVNWLVPFK